MDAQLNAELENAQRSLRETFELAVVHGDDAAKDPAQYLQLMATLCELRHKAQRGGHALELAKEARTIDDFDRVYAAELDKSGAKKFDPTKTEDYLMFQKSLKLTVASHAVAAQAAESSEGSRASTSAAAAAAAPEDDIVMESDVINAIDPLTKQRMQNPVRNSRCGHHYEKDTVLEAIRINKRLRCPVAGCGNKAFVHKAQLVDDEVFRMRLMQAKEAESEDPLG